MYINNDGVHILMLKHTHKNRLFFIGAGTSIVPRLLADSTESLLLGPWFIGIGRSGGGGVGGGGCA